MPGMIRKFDDFESLQETWTSFSSLLYQELKSLKEEKERNEIERKKYETLIKIINESRNNIEFLLKHKKAFVELDPSLEQVIMGIEVFNNINGLNNPAISYLIQQIFDSQSISTVQERVDYLDSVEISLMERITSIDDLRTGKVFDDTLIKELCEKFECDKITTRKIRMYPLRKTVKKKEIKSTINKEKDNQPRVTEETVMEKIQIIDKNPSIDEQNSQIIDGMQTTINSNDLFDLDDDYGNVQSETKNISMKNPTSESELSHFSSSKEQLQAVDYKSSSNDYSLEQMEKHEEILEENDEEVLADNSENIPYYEIQKKRYSELDSTYGEISKRYFDILNKMQPIEIATYEIYSKLTDEEFKKIDDSSVKSNYEEAEAKILSLKLIKLKKDIEDTINIVTGENFNDKDNIEFLEELINEYQNIGDKLIQVDKKVLEKNKNTHEVDNLSNVYFLIDDTEKIVLPSEATEFLPIYSKMAKLEEVDNIIKTAPFLVKDVSDSLGRTPFARRINNSAISFVKIKANEDSTGNSILIIAAAPISRRGYTAIQKETRRIVSQYGSEIKSQIDLIEGRNSEYLQLQEEIREGLRQLTPPIESGGRK